MTASIFLTVFFPSFPSSQVTPRKPIRVQEMQCELHSVALDFWHLSGSPHRVPPVSLRPGRQQLCSRSWSEADMWGPVSVSTWRGEKRSAEFFFFSCRSRGRSWPPAAGRVTFLHHHGRPHIPLKMQRLFGTFRPGRRTTGTGGWRRGRARPGRPDQDGFSFIRYFAS